MKVLRKAGAVMLSAVLVVGMVPSAALATTAQDAAKAEQAFTERALESYDVQSVGDGTTFDMGYEESAAILAEEGSSEGEAGTEPEQPAEEEKLEAGTVAKLKGTYIFTLSGTNLRMANSSGSSSTSKQMTLVNTTSSKARFYLQRVSSGSNWCYIRNAASGHALTAVNGKVIQQKTTKNTNQRWKVLKMSDGTYAIQSNSTGLRIGVSSAKSGEGLVLQKASNAKTQRFGVKASSASYMLDRTKMISILNGASNAKDLRMVNCSYSIPTTQRKALQKEIKRTKARCSKFGFVLVDLRTGEGFSYDSNADIHSASSLKGPYLASINKYQSSKAKKYRSHYYPLIHYSSNEEYAYLRGKFGSSSFKKFMKLSDVKDISYKEKYQNIQVKSLAKLWVSTWEYLNGGTANAKNIRGLYKHILGSEICTVLGSKKGYTTYTKGGWVPNSGKYTSYNSCGIVCRPDGTRYLLCIMTRLNPYGGDMKQMQRLIRAIDNAYGAVSRES